jgi:GDP-mannose 6-dehydrogenase
MARITVFGLGYVGAVTTAALAGDGHEVTGVDASRLKVDMLNEGRSPVIEAGLTELVAAGLEAGRIRATTDPAEGMRGAEVSMICVGTPSRSNGSLDLRQVERVCHDIGGNLRAAADGHVVAVRSTMLPGSTYGTVIPALEQASSARAGRDFGVCVNPEFLREGSSISDFRTPPFTLLGVDDDVSAAPMTAVYDHVDADALVVPIPVAEMVKYTCNAFHAVKVAFANEIGAICKEEDIDSHAVMDVFLRDTRLNISGAYLRPGFAFGGSCLPKDLRALTYNARRHDVSVPLLDAVLPSNQHQIDRAFHRIQRTGHKRVGVLGFSFKAGTDDLRESPLVELVERLIGKGYEVRLFDRNVSLANLHGANRAYITHEIPHIASLMCDSIDDVLAGSDVIVIGNASREFADALAGVRGDQVVLDLVRIAEADGAVPGYDGFNW